MFSFVKQYFYNWFVLISQAISVFLGGEPDTSISQRTAIAYNSHKGTGSGKEKWFSFQQKFIDCLLWVLAREENHCQNSIVGENNTKELWKW